jgi:hypothetical protein
MYLTDLKSKLETNQKIPADSYSLTGGLPNESLCIARTSGHWEVYYSERGSKSNLKMFQNEAEACEYFYFALLKMLNI